MKNRLKKLLPLWCIVLIAATCQAQEPTFISPSSPHIAYIGRVSFTRPESPCFTYPGVEIRTLFEGTSIAMKMKPNSGYFMVRIDGGEAFKITVLEQDSIVTLADGLTDSRHEVRIILANEGYIRRPEFRGFILDKGKTLPAAPTLPTRRIEFIGNSITCGYGVETLDPKAPFRDETENHYYTFAATTARAFDAQHLVVARSGIGIYRNYGGPVTGSPNCMPAMYNQTLFNDSTEIWEFNRFTPDVVCINLGTNDTSTRPYDTKLLENGYRTFLRTVRSNYPDAAIILLTGSMLSGKALQDVQHALNTVATEAHAAGDARVYRFDLSPQDGSLGYGADYHPSKAQHAKNAGELTRFISQVTGWTTVD